jgi:hypothetical protein
MLFFIAFDVGRSDEDPVTLFQLGVLSVQLYGIRFTLRF